MLNIAITRQEFKQRTGLDPEPLVSEMTVIHGNGEAIKYVFTDPAPPPRGDEFERWLERLADLEDTRE